MDETRISVVVRIKAVVSSNLSCEVVSLAFFYVKFTNYKTTIFPPLIADQERYKKVGFN